MTAYTSAINRLKMSIVIIGASSSVFILAGCAAKFYEPPSADVIQDVSELIGKWRIDDIYSNGIINDQYGLLGDAEQLNSQINIDAGGDPGEIEISSNDLTSSVSQKKYTAWLIEIDGKKYLCILNDALWEIFIIEFSSNNENIKLSSLNQEQLIKQVNDNGLSGVYLKGGDGSDSGDVQLAIENSGDQITSLLMNNSNISDGNNAFVIELSKIDNEEIVVDMTKSIKHENTMNYAAIILEAMGIIAGSILFGMIAYGKFGNRRLL